jgi:hypothetical protein
MRVRSLCNLTGTQVISLIQSYVCSWAGTSFKMVELVLTAGFACTYKRLRRSIVLEGLEAGP